MPVPCQGLPGGWEASGRGQALCPVTHARGSEQNFGLTSQGVYCSDSADRVFSLWAEQVTAASPQVWSPCLERRAAARVKRSAFPGQLQRWASPLLRSRMQTPCKAHIRHVSREWPQQAVGQAHHEPSRSSDARHCATRTRAPGFPPWRSPQALTRKTTSTRLHCTATNAVVFL